jgi:hypothetical protein
MRDKAVGGPNEIIWNDYWTGRNSAGADIDYTRLYGGISNATAGSEQGIFTFRVRVAGVEVPQLNISNGVSIGAPALAQLGNGTLNVGGFVYINGTKVLGIRETGWAAPTGTATRTAFPTSTVTLPQLAERVKALIDDLMAHGLIGV